MGRLPVSTLFLLHLQTTPVICPGQGFDVVGSGDSSEPSETKECWKFQGYFSLETSSKGWQLPALYRTLPSLPGAEGWSNFLRLRAERRFPVYPPVKATKPQTGCANKVKELVDEETAGTARDASTLGVKPDAGLKDVGWIPKEAGSGLWKEQRSESGVGLGKCLRQGHVHLVLRESGARSRLLHPPPSCFFSMRIYRRVRAKQCWL